MKNEKRFNAEQRIRGQVAFKNLVENGKFVRGRFFYLWIGNSATLGQGEITRPMLGVIVNKKTQPRATKRNLIKRRVREFFRSRQNTFKPGNALLIKAREGKPLPGAKETEEDLTELIKKAGIFL